jgi:hypothetical protein
MSYESKLTPHQRWIEQELASGKTKADIARSLNVSRTTLSSFLASPVFTGQTSPTVKGREVTMTEEVSVEEMLQARVKELERALTRDRNAAVAQERIITAVQEAVRVAEPPNILTTAKVRMRFAETLSGEPAHHRQVVLLSDFHGGEVVDPVAVNGLNAYSWAIMEQRVEEVIASLLSHKEHSPALTGLDVIFNGDMCGGINHQELAETNEFGLAEQAIKMGYVQGQILERLAPHYADIRSLVIVGNHPRLPVKPAAKRVHENGDWIAGVVAKEYIRDLENVTLSLPKSAAALWEVAGLTFYVSHGDGVRSSMPGVPWGGLIRRFNQIKATYSRQANLAGWFCGHFHQPNAIFDQGIFMNGALKGTDEWVQKNFGGGSRPAQLLLTFDEKRSRQTDVKLITPTAGLEDLRG